MDNIVINQVNSERELLATRQLFREYADSLGISLCFQQFEEELASLPGKYTPPSGRLLLAWDGERAAGCVGLRPLEPSVCEMKRLYVRPAWRGQGLGRYLATSLIRAARDAGYDCMRLDTLSSMRSAICLYSTLGFRAIAPYYENPIENAVFMELVLNHSPERHRCSGTSVHLPD